MTSVVGKRILLVEDEALLAMAFQDMLEDLGTFVLGPCQSVEHALELIKAVDELDGALLLSLIHISEPTRPY